MNRNNRRRWNLAWKPGIYFRKIGGANPGVYRLDEWLQPGSDLAWCKSKNSDYTAAVLVNIDDACYRVRKDGQEYVRTSKLAAAARDHNFAKGRAQYARVYLLDLIRREFPEQSPMRAELLFHTEMLSERLLCALESKWLYTKNKLKRTQKIKDKG